MVWVEEVVFCGVLVIIGVWVFGWLGGWILQVGVFGLFYIVDVCVMGELLVFMVLVIGIVGWMFGWLVDWFGSLVVLLLMYLVINEVGVVVVVLVQWCFGILI